MKAKKSLGQNFLIDNSIISRIVENINASKDDLIIEIGPGRGALTEKLKNKGAFLICYEVDTDLKVYLNHLEDDKTKIIYQDILSSDIKEDIKDIKYNKLFIVGNLPYYITTPIIKYLIDLNLNVNEMIFMVQKEVADRFSAVPNTHNYGSITLYLKYFFNVEKLFTVSKKCFNPIPKVESAIIKFSERNDKPNVDREKYFKLINDSFKMKRKNLKNNLNNYDYVKVKNILNKYNLDDNIRAEQLDEKIFIDITNNL